jgi:hypothetical protein
MTDPRRYLAAVIVLVPATSVTVGRLFQTDGPNTRTTLDLIAANPDRQVIFAVLGYLGLLTAVPAFLAAARLCRRRRPVLTMIALVVNHSALLGAFSISTIDSLYLVGGLLPQHQRDAAATVIDRMQSTELAVLGTELFVFGHIIGTILLGFALRGSIATIGWMAMLITTPAHVLAVVVLQMPGVDVLAWLLMAVGFGYCAAAIIKAPDATSSPGRDLWAAGSSRTGRASAERGGPGFSRPGPTRPA